MDYTVNADLMLIKELTGERFDDLAVKFDVEKSTLFRWFDGKVYPSKENLEKIYSFAFSKGIRLNRIYEQLFKEDYQDEENVVLFHGAREEIHGKLSLGYSKKTNDFGRGFYCGESMAQSAMFVSDYDNSSVYTLLFDRGDLKCEKYTVSQDWMLTVSYFRGRLKEYANNSLLLSLEERVKNADYVIAPIADNHMFQTLDNFSSGAITSEQCAHSLSATSLGYQYVFLTERALKNVKILRRGYLAEKEKNMYVKERLKETKLSEDKVKVALREYRGKGLYIDDILK